MTQLDALIDELKLLLSGGVTHRKSNLIKWTGAPGRLVTLALTKMREAGLAYQPAHGHWRLCD